MDRLTTWVFRPFAGAADHPVNVVDANGKARGSLPFPWFRDTAATERSRSAGWGAPRREWARAEVADPRPLLREGAGRSPTRAVFRHTGSRDVPA